MRRQKTQTLTFLHQKGGRQFEPHERNPHWKTLKQRRNQKTKEKQLQINFKGNFRKTGRYSAQVRRKETEKQRKGRKWKHKRANGAVGRSNPIAEKRDGWEAAFGGEECVDLESVEVFKRTMNFQYLYSF